MFAASGPALADGACGTFVARGSRVDLAPPAGMIDICSRDAVLCNRLTSGYPPSTKTLGYFVTTDEWNRYEAGTSRGFERYLIAQAAMGTPASAFEGLRDFIRSRQGVIPDHSTLPSVLQATGRASLGVLEDSSDAIVVGVVSSLRLLPPAVGEMTLASTNIALLSQNEVLSLYVFVDVSKELDTAPVTSLTKQWLGCIRSANRASAAQQQAPPDGPASAASPLRHDRR